MRMRGAVVATLLAVAGSGCNGDSTAANDSAEDLAGAVCDLFYECCTAGEAAVLIGPYVTQDDCAERIVNSASLAPGATINLAAFGAGGVELPNLADLQQAIDDGRTEVDRDAVDACIAYIGTLACAIEDEEEPVTGCVPPEPVEETPCDAALLFRGKVGDGGACSSPGVSYECKEGLACRSGGALGVEGACVEPGDVGDLCFFDAECQEELYCSQFDGTCQVPKAEGESCLFSNPEDLNPSSSTLLIECEPLLSCDPVTDTCVAACQRGASCGGDFQCDDEQGLICVLGRCDLPRIEGLPCGADDDCETGRCDFDVSTGLLLCAPKLANGEPCSSFSGDEDCASGFCDPSLLECADQVAAGGLCESARDSQCADAYCETNFVSCSSDAECLGSGSCNLTFGRCEYYCVSQRADGSMCTRSAQCQSLACVDGFCRTLPLADGQPCSFDSQCESEFCNLDFPRVCDTLPLPNGQPCSSSSQCESGVCFSGSCDAGLGDGADCSDPFDPPCGRDLYCSSETTPVSCVPVREAGEPCVESFQCRGSCTIRFGRTLCDTTPAEGTVVCDGS